MTEDMKKYIGKYYKVLDDLPMTFGSGSDFFAASPADWDNTPFRVGAVCKVVNVVIGAYGYQYAELKFADERSFPVNCTTLKSTVLREVSKLEGMMGVGE